MLLYVNWSETVRDSAVTRARPTTLPRPGRLAESDALSQLPGLTEYHPTDREYERRVTYIARPSW
jgi:hypothetical protein